MLSQLFSRTARRGDNIILTCRLASNVTTITPRQSQSRSCENDIVKRARLLYQSRKRGTLENGLLFSSFAAKHLEGMTKLQLEQFDHLLNNTDSEWQLYYWITGHEAAPPEFDCEVLHLLQSHCHQHTHAHNQQPHLYHHTQD